MEMQDFLVKQIQQFMQAMLRRLLDIWDLTLVQNQDSFASELSGILEQMSGLDQRTLEETDVKALAYILNLRMEGENKLILAAALRLQATCQKPRAERWEMLADLVEKDAQGAIVSRTTEELLKSLEAKRKLIG